MANLNRKQRAILKQIKTDGHHMLRVQDVDIVNAELDLLSNEVPELAPEPEITAPLFAAYAGGKFITMDQVSNTPVTIKRARI